MAEGKAEFDLLQEGDVVIARAFGPELRHPSHAQQFGADVEALCTVDGYRKILLDLRHVKYMSSTGFATLLGTHQKIKAAGGRLAICNLHPDVAVGANIIGLGRVVDTYPDESEGIASFSAAT
jgi:anti-sigma B factor antagonist